jgi:putative NADH-flavin reductase
MKILIFGASGATGHNLVSQAIIQKHIVSAFVRSPSNLKIDSDKIRIVKGNVIDYETVANAVTNQDAVLSALGASGPFRRDYTLITGVQNITRAMMERGVRRFIYQSYLGVKEDRRELGFVINYILPIVLRNIILDHEAKESIIVNSDIDWTIVRCPILTNGSFTGSYRDGEHVTSTSLLPAISRADVAEFMLKQLADDKYLNKKPRILR